MIKSLFYANIKLDKICRRCQSLLDVSGVVDDPAVQRERHMDPVQELHRGVPSSANALPQLAQIPERRGVPLSRGSRRGECIVSTLSTNLRSLITFN